MKLFKITICLLLLNLSILSAVELLKITGEVVNPACIKLMQPWLSEDSNSTIIIKSVVLDTCQNSNLAFVGQNPTVDSDGTVSYYEDTSNIHSYFSYRYLGKNSKDIIYMYHNGTIGRYTITKESIIIDFLHKTTKNVSIITKLSETSVQCFQDAIIKNDTLVIKVKKYNAGKSNAFKCSKINNTLTISN